MLKTIPKAIARALEHTIVTHDGVEHAGYLAFIGLLSLFPFLVFIIAFAGFLGEGELGREFVMLLRDILPQESVSILLPRIDEILKGPPRGLLTVSMLAALWTASSAVEGYRTILNRAYHVGTPPAYVWRRLLSVLQLLVLTAFIISGMLTLLLLPSTLGWLQHVTGLPVSYGELQEVGSGIQILTSLLLLAIVSLAYYTLPNIRQTLGAVLPGAVVTIALWALAVKGLRLYLQSFDQMDLIYGSLAGMIAALLFFYIINLIFIFGAEFNYQLLLASGSRVEEKEETEEGVEPPKEDDVEAEEGERQ